ncbi:anti-sigma-D factor RsdA [Dactylosporangium sp. NPDC000244]|uniref:anti-sigma-D factor RsdA n=1 Tax=Dactylosporangium sp. NPDC000244 TaxID=3154365 RepID=UPI00331B1B8F
MDSSGEAPVDLATVRADDALLDALARGSRPASPSPSSDDDALAGLLADWHDDLSADLPDFDLSSEPSSGDALPDLPELRTAFDLSSEPSSGDALPDLPELRTAAPETDGTQELPVVAPRPRRRPGSGLRRTFAAVAAAVVILGGLALGAERSSPSSPLWPLTQVLYPEQAHARAAEQAIAEAADAIAAARWDDARRLLDTATGEAEQVDTAGTRRRLLDRIADLRSQLPSLTPPSPSPTTPPAPTTEAAPATPTPAPGATTPGANPGGGGGATKTPGGNGEILPGLPTQIVPTGPGGLPLPTRILPSVPGLPLPTL